MNINKRSRNWGIITYDILEYHLFDFLDNDEHINHYAFIKHCCDKNEDGTFKEPHYHILINYSTSISGTALITYIKSKIPYFQSNIMLEPITDKYAMYRYLSHKDDLDKYQYDDSDIISDDSSFWTAIRSDSQDDINQLIDDLINRKSYREMAIKYGRDFIKNYQNYFHYARMVEAQELENNFTEENK